MIWISDSTSKVTRSLGSSAQASACNDCWSWSHATHQHQHHIWVRHTTHSLRWLTSQYQSNKGCWVSQTFYIDIGFYWFTINVFNWKIYGHHFPIKLHLQAKLKLQAFCSFWTIMWRKTLSINQRPHNDLMMQNISWYWWIVTLACKNVNKSQNTCVWHGW